MKNLIIYIFFNLKSIYRKLYLLPVKNLDDNLELCKQCIAFQNSFRHASENIWQPLIEGIHPGVGLLHQMVNTSSVLLEYITLFFKLSSPIRATGALTAKHPTIHWGLLEFSIFAKLVGVKWHFMVVLICIFPI